MAGGSPWVNELEKLGISLAYCICLDTDNSITKIKNKKRIFVKEFPHFLNFWYTFPSFFKMSFNFWGILPHLFTHSFTHLFSYSHTHLYTHSFIYSLKSIHFQCGMWGWTLLPRLAALWQRCGRPEPHPNPHLLHHCQPTQGQEGQMGSVASQ